MGLLFLAEKCTRPYRMPHSRCRARPTHLRPQQSQVRPSRWKLTHGLALSLWFLLLCPWAPLVFSTFAII